jgi:hypothetical protein
MRLDGDTRGLYIFVEPMRRSGNLKRQDGGDGDNPFHWPSSFLP